MARKEDAPGSRDRDHESARAPAVEMRAITKRFAGVIANDAVDFALAKGEVHALLGENGAGKTTLMNVLCGIYEPDAGEIHIDGRPARIRSPREAIDAGVGMVHQEFMLAASLTVAENIVLGLREPRFLLRWADVNRMIAERSRQLGLAVDPSAPVWQLSVGERQRVEILKALMRGARILVLDEPTAALGPRESDELFAAVRGLAALGNSIVLISHKLGEVRRIADRLTVLRRGRSVVVGRAAAGASEDELAELMVGRPVRRSIAKAPSAKGGVILSLRDVSAQSDKGALAIQNVSVEVSAGEIVGVAGVAGNGQRELCEAACGVRPVTSGEVRVGSADLTGRPVSDFLAAGVAYVPEDRQADGAVGALSVAENLALKSFRDPPLARGFGIDPAAVERCALERTKAFGIEVPTVRVAAEKLSGGNLQKMILARELSTRPSLLIACQPTRGLDVGASEVIHEILRKERERGVATLLFSEDLDELLALSDRVVVLYGGRIVGEVDPAATDLAVVGRLMAGLPADAPESEATT